ncbi:MAG: GGDEF domain-containing protein [Microthrixaceae bacterium]
MLSVASANDELQRLATTDSLTGLANRRRFFTAAAGIIARPDPETVTLVGMVDVDSFKLVNDRHGHAAGDAVLATLAERLRRAVGDNTSVVGRLGGDEFGIVLTAPEDVLVAVTDALQQACSDIEIGSSDLARATHSACVAQGATEPTSRSTTCSPEPTPLYAAKLARRLNPPASLV